ncbi:hypothetical protein SNEBB_010900 [Seison nebaliae]|nr:hypothetical protein SNEBB_010900 [Seison nebaliae]
MVGNMMSGKTEFVRKLKNFIEEDENYSNVHLVDEDELLKTINMSKEAMYLDKDNEKQHRALIKGNIVHHLDQEKIVIVDAANYIKGYRYELYCLCKERETTQCLILMNVGIDELLRRNHSLKTYHSSTIEAVQQRFEYPSVDDRWELPLIEIFNSYNEEKIKLSMKQVLNLIIDGMKQKPNMATLPTTIVSSTNIISFGQIINNIQLELLEKMKDVIPVTEIPIENSKIPFMLKRDYRKAEIKRVATQFRQRNKELTHSTNIQLITTHFIDYINTSLL